MSSTFKSTDPSKPRASMRTRASKRTSRDSKSPTDSITNSFKNLKKHLEVKEEAMKILAGQIHELRKQLEKANGELDVVRKALKNAGAIIHMEKQAREAAEQRAVDAQKRADATACGDVDDTFSDTTETDYSPNFGPNLDFNSGCRNYNPTPDIDLETFEELTGEERLQQGDDPEARLSDGTFCRLEKGDIQFLEKLKNEFPEEKQSPTPEARLLAGTFCEPDDGDIQFLEKLKNEFEAYP